MAVETVITSNLFMLYACEIDEHFALLLYHFNVSECNVMVSTAKYSGFDKIYFNRLSWSLRQKHADAFPLVRNFHMETILQRTCNFSIVCCKFYISNISGFSLTTHFVARGLKPLFSPSGIVFICMPPYFVNQYQLKLFLKSTMSFGTE